MAKTLKTRKEFEPYVRLLADRLGLKDWSFEVEDYEPNNCEAIAAIHIVTGRKFAVIRFRADLLKETPQQQRHTVIHELIHAHFALVNGFVCGGGQPGESLSLALEYAVDGLADAVAPLMPLPGARPK